MLHDPQDIVDSFGPQKKEIQIAVLWRLLQIHDSSVVYPPRSDDEHQEMLRASFEYISNEWPPRKVAEKDTARLITKTLECQSSVDNTGNKYIEMKDAHVGYYQNGKKKGLQYPQEIKSKIGSMNSGFVLVDSGFDLMLVAEQNDVYSLFYWFWGA